MVPLSAQAKDNAAGIVFRRAAWAVSWSATYQNWKAQSDRFQAYIEDLKNRADQAHQPDSYQELSALGRPQALLARAIAFYLPQFHPIAENDRWWGQGFTEWTNVLRSQPQFEGHEQPRVPGELGYYDLVENPEIRKRQAALASQYGLSGFCFYFYWFAGKRLLETPVKAYADDPAITFPFCLCWANENWSRRWDGRGDDVLIAQAHSEDDDLAIIQHLSNYLKNSKYIRIGGRPLVIVYRPGLLPDAKATALRWRRWCRDNGIGEIHLAYTQSFDTVDPAEYGFDSAIEFPPNNMGLEPQDHVVTPTSDQFKCRIYDWKSLNSGAETIPADKEYTLFHGVTPQWDNTPRRMNAGTILLGSSPDAYELWLKRVATDAAKRHSKFDERLVFINAWNEWAEGCYLEPDVTHGYAWLAATRRALLPGTGETLVEPSELVPLEQADAVTVSRKIIVMVHDLHRNGAQYLSLNFVRSLRKDFGYEVVTITSGEGDLGPNFRTYGRILELNEKRQSRDGILEQLAELREDGFCHAIINSSASGWIAPYLDEVGIASVGLVHEMPDIARNMKLRDGMLALDQFAKATVFATELVRDRTASNTLGREWRRSKILPQGLYKREGVLGFDDKERARTKVCADLKVQDNARFVIGVGFGDRRKGVDLFCQWAVAAARKDPLLHFIWVGEIEISMMKTCRNILDRAPDVTGQVHLIGFRNDTSIFYAGACAYALTSREDPYPSTVLEALSAGAPAFVVAGATGIEDLGPTGAVHVLASSDAEAFAKALTDFLSDASAVKKGALAGLDVVREKFGFKSFVGDILRLLGEPIPKVSVIVPSFNYARFLPQRLATILNQSMPVWEIIFLDDASEDDSIEIARRFLHNCSIRCRIIRNDANSGSVFAQWKKGIDLAEGDIVWIAEADDWAASTFVETAALAFADTEVVVSYTQSNQASAAGEIICPDYLEYVREVDADRWRRPFVTEGMSELAEGLSVKNTLPNVSGVLFRREALKQVLESHFEEISSYRVAGDWCTYMYLATIGRIAFDPRPLNYHRRHEQSVTISRFSQAEWEEIQRMQKRVSEMVDVPAALQVKAADYLAALAERIDSGEKRP
tara:strand:+ start:21903 stop:25202 length:3300 start_codon:yes stop_codon:yes gene_type:complete